MVLLWLQTLAATFTGIAAVVSFVRYGESRNNGQLFISFCFLLTACIFAFLAYRGWTAP